MLPNYVEPELPQGSLGRLGARLKTFASQVASQIPTGASVLMLAEQESALTAEEGALEECLLQAIEDERDPATAFFLLFITAFKRWSTSGGSISSSQDSSLNSTQSQGILRHNCYL